MVTPIIILQEVIIEDAAFRGQIDHIINAHTLMYVKTTFIFKIPCFIKYCSYYRLVFEDQLMQTTI